MVARIHAIVPLLAPLLAAFCGCESPRPPASLPPPAPPLAPQVPLATTQAPAGAESSPPRFIEDDYPRALAEARARGLPLFIDTWAPWCHTCLSMREYVFSDALLAPFASRFVFLSLDTEREGNAGVVDKLGVRVLPTMFVMDPKAEKVAFAWPGSMTSDELVDLLREASSTAAPARWLDPDRLADVRVSGLAEAKRFPECVEAAADEAPKMPMGTALFDVLRAGLDCAASLPAASAARGRIQALLTQAEHTVSQTSTMVLADDRSDLYDFLVGALRALDRRDESMRLARDWARFLEGQASRASTPTARAVFDAHRLGAYLALGEPQRAVPMLEQSAIDFPEDYNPPARLAAAYFAMKSYDDALVAVKRALARAYGPRKLRLWSLEADVLLAKGDRAGASDALRAAVDFARATPLTGSYPKLRDALEKRLSGLR
jgi:tetratricopeptide (TPR) repeat protein